MKRIYKLTAAAVVGLAVGALVAVAAQAHSTGVSHTHVGEPTDFGDSGLIGDTGNADDTVDLADQLGTKVIKTFTDKDGDGTEDAGEVTYTTTTRYDAQIATNKAAIGGDFGDDPTDLSLNQLNALVHQGPNSLAAKLAANKAAADDAIVKIKAAAAAAAAAQVTRDGGQDTKIAANKKAIATNEAARLAEITRQAGVDAAQDTKIAGNTAMIGTLSDGEAGTAGTGILGVLEDHAAAIGTAPDEATADALAMAAANAGVVETESHAAASYDTLWAGVETNARWNVAQDTRIAGNTQRIEALEDDVEVLGGGVASALALSAVPGLSADKRFSLGLGTGYHAGKAAIAGAVQGRLTKALTARLGLAYGGSDVAAQAGVAFQF